MDGMDSLAAAPILFARGRLVRDSDLSVILQLIEAAICHNVSGADACNLCYACVSNSRPYSAQVSDIVLNDINKRSLPILLNGRRWNQGHSLQRIHQQARVDKLIR